MARMKVTHIINRLKINPIPVLLASKSEAIVYFTKRDLLGGSVPPINYVWDLPEVKKTTSGQQVDGSWKGPGKKSEIYPAYHHSLVETFKRFRILVKRYEFNRESPVIEKAAELLFSCQTEDGDIRGFIGNQYATYYTGEVLALLIKAGYAEDKRVERGMQWLLNMRQNDGGWTIPMITHKLDRETWYRLTSQYTEPLEPDRMKPFSHNWTDMVLRAFAAHPRYRHSPEVLKAAELLKSRFFQPDVYSSYKNAGYWTRFQFWWPNLLTALESLLLLGFSLKDPDIKKALDWFIINQPGDGLWDMAYSARGKNSGKVVDREWLSLEVCRMLKGYAQADV